MHSLMNFRLQPLRPSNLLTKVNRLIFSNSTYNENRCVLLYFLNKNAVMELCRDILYVVAEKMLMIEQSGCELKLAKASDFMFINKSCKSNYIYQFSKFKAIDHVVRDGDIEISLYKRRSFNWFANEDDNTGPFRVDVAFLHLLVAHRRLAPKRIQTQYISYVAAEGTKSTDEATFSPATTPFQALLLLLNIDGLDLPEIDLPVNKVGISKVGSSDCNNNNYRLDLVTIFALNAKMYEISAELPDYDCFIVPVDARVSSDRTEDISLTFNLSWDALTDDGESFQTFPEENWLNMLLFIFRSCHALKRFDIRIDFPGDYDTCLSLLITRISKAMHAFVFSILPAVFSTVQPPDDMRMFIQIRANISQYENLSTVPIRNCQLLSNMGNYKTDSGDEISRFALFDRLTLALSAEKKQVDAEKVEKKNDHSDDDDECTWREADDKGPGCWLGYALFRSTEDAFQEEVIHDYHNEYQSDYFADADLEYGSDEMYSMGDLEEMNDEFLF